jgi:ornithine cyclodeaminase/alanine dehydrogenase-like protein (mu-crystallin family)
MRIISADEIDSALSYPELLETLLRAYRSQTVVPPPARFDIVRPGTAPGVLHTAPAWTNFNAHGHADRGYIGCALSLTLPDGSPEAGQTGSGLYALFSGSNGHPVALLDGTRMRAWRICALHAMAARYLSREDTERLLVFGSDPLLPQQLAAYASVRSVRSVLLAGGAEDHAEGFRSDPSLKQMNFGTTDDMAGAVSGADMICVSAAALPRLPVEDLPPGVHVDVLGAAVNIPEPLGSNARLFVSEHGATAGFGTYEVAADLRELTVGERAGRRFYSQITLFSSGEPAALADLAVAGHVFLRS